MRKVLWICTGFAVLLTVGVILAADYVHRQPGSFLGRAVVTAYQAGFNANPWVARTNAKPVAVAADEPTADQIEQVRQVVEEVMRTELPPVNLIGSIIIPDEVEPPLVVVVPGEELSEIPFMVPLLGEVPLTMPYLRDLIAAQAAQQPHHGCTWDGCGTLVKGKGLCETTREEMTRVVGKCETTAAEMGRAVVGRCETTDEEIIKALFGGTGEELSEPMEELPLEPSIRKPEAVKLLNDRPKMVKPY